MSGRACCISLLLAAALAGCTASSTLPSAPVGPVATTSRAPTATATPIVTATPVPTVTPIPSPKPTAASTATASPTPPPPTPAPTSTASTAPPPVTFKAGDTALVAAGAVRAHVDHFVEADRFTPMLARGTSMLVLEGPKHGSGYHWYRVALINAAFTGVSAKGNQDIRDFAVWVPVASRDGEPWLRKGSARCPPKPANVLELYAVPLGARLTCLSGVPITLEARIVTNDVACDYDPGMSIRPAWFAGARVELPDGSSHDLGLATPAGVAPEPPCPPFETLLYVDPAGSHPDPLPLDQAVTVTGMFDHPAAATCTWKWGEDPWTATDACRSWFVATSIVP